MTATYLVDTDVISEPLRPVPSRSVTERLREHDGHLAIASVTWHELWFGCRRLPDSARRRAIEEYLDQVVAPNIPIVPYDDRAAEWHAIERARLSASGHTPPFADGQIASVAKTNAFVLVTGNIAHYALFDDLAVECWHEAQ